MLEYFDGQELGDAGLWLRDGKGALVDLSTGYTFEVKAWLASAATAAFTKTDDISGAAGAGREPDGTPNLVIQWDATGELDQLDLDTRYRLQVRANRTADSKDHVWDVEGGVIVRTAAP